MLQRTRHQHPILLIFEKPRHPQDLLAPVVLAQLLHHPHRPAALLKPQRRFLQQQPIHRSLNVNLQRHQLARRIPGPVNPPAGSGPYQSKHLKFTHIRQPHGLTMAIPHDSANPSVSG